MKVQRPGGGLKLRSKLRKVFLYSNYLVIYPLQCKDQVVRPMSPEYWEDCPPKAIIPVGKTTSAGLGTFEYFKITSSILLLLFAMFI